MRLPPKKPHFFKPVLPGFKNGITIPPNFFRFLNGTKHEKAVLKRGGKEWHVKINHGKLGDDGWKRFSEDNDFHIGDFAIFGHEGNMVFEVLRFDPTTCLNTRSAPVIKVEPVETVLEAKEESSSRSETEEAEEETSSGYIQSEELKRGPKAAPVAETIPSKERPCFVSIIRPSNVKYPHLYVPIYFARQNGLLKEYCKITLVDDLQRSWPAVLRRKKSHVCIGSGWRNFREANGLKVGDRFKFEIIKNGKTPVVNFTLVAPVIKVKPAETVKAKGETSSGSETEEPAEVTSLGSETEEAEEETSAGSETEEAEEETSLGSTRYLQSEELKRGPKTAPVAETIPSKERLYFVSFIKPYNVKRPFLCVPMYFARQNGLLKKHCKITLVDDLQRSWPAVLRHYRTYVSIGSGWTDFREANGLKVGDRFKFEIIKTGKTPVVNITLELKKEPKATPVAETISFRECPYFVSFIKPFNVKFPRLYVPKDFAKENGLLKKYCEITLVDDLQRSWPVVLRHNISCVSIGSGWVNFREANGLKVGDRFKFEIIKAGKTPVVNFTLELKKGPKVTPVAETISCRERPHFVSFIKPCNVKYDRLYLPKEFAKKNGLIKKCRKITLVDDLQRSWPVVLRHDQTHVSLSSGWIDFREANDLKAGDRFKFEIIKNGKEPVANFTLLGKDCRGRDDENVDMN